MHGTVSFLYGIVIPGMKETIIESISTGRAANPLAFPMAMPCCFSGIVSAFLSWDGRRADFLVVAPLPIVESFNPDSE
jgi:hypothetical protein